MAESITFNRAEVTAQEIYSLGHVVLFYESLVGVIDVVHPGGGIYNIRELVNGATHDAVKQADIQGILSTADAARLCAQYLPPIQVKE